MNLADRHYEPFNQDDAEEERKNFLSVLAAFRFYRYENSFFFPNFSPPYVRRMIAPKRDSTIGEHFVWHFPRKSARSLPRDKSVSRIVHA